MIFCVIFTGIKRTSSHVSRSGWVTKESRLLRVPHRHPLHLPLAKTKQDFHSFRNENFNIPDKLTLSGWFTGLSLLTVLYVTQIWITVSSMQIDPKRLQLCVGSSFSAPATLVFEKMNGETQKTVSPCHYPQYRCVRSYSGQEYTKGRFLTPPSDTCFNKLRPRCDYVNLIIVFFKQQATF